MSMLQTPVNDPFARDVWAILGMPIDNLSVDEAASVIEDAVRRGRRLSFVTPNVNWLVRALKQPDAMAQIVNADLSLADGAPIVWLARKLGMPLKQRCSGADVFECLRRDTGPNALPIKVFFFGGRDGAAEAACAALAAEGGRMVPVGWHNPGFGDVSAMSSADVLAKINAAEPDFIVVALGAAKGQAWIERNLDGLDAPVLAHLGAVVDFVAGTIRRAPSFVSRMGLEWIWRIVAEPALWRRYWTDGKALLAFSVGRLRVLQRASRVARAPKTLQIEIDGHALHLSGAAVVAARGDLRRQFREIAACGGDVTLNLSNTDTIDAAAFGQIRMLEQVLTRRGAHLEINSGARLAPAFEAAGFNLSAQTVL